MLEKLAEYDDNVMMAYLEGRNPSGAELKEVIRRVTIDNKLVPVLCGSAFRNKAIQPLLDAITNYLPAPSDLPPVKAIDARKETEVLRPAQDDAPFTALAFKVVSDPFMGRLVYLRVYSGKIKAGAEIYNSTKGQRERIGRILLMHANRREEVAEADTGAIIASLGLKNTFTGDTLCHYTQPVLLENIRFPEPVLSIAIEPRTKADQEKMEDALRRLTEEDPTFKVNYNQETGQTIISGMGELHLEVLVKRMLSEFGVGAKVGKPRVSYKESITVPVKVQGRFVQQTGGRGQYGHVVIQLEPLESGAGFQFVNQIKSGAIPRQFVPPVEAGIREAMETGGAMGYPVVDIKATLLDGSYHEVDSSEIAFKIAGSMALKDGVARGKPVVLEPIMKMEVVTPREFVGDIMADLGSRRGNIESMETEAETCTIKALIPLAESFGYTTTIRSLSQGRATHAMEFYRYQELPAELAEQIRISGRKYA